MKLSREIDKTDVSPIEELPQIGQKQDPVVGEANFGAYSGQLHESGSKSVTLEKIRATFRSPTVREAIEVSRLGKDSNAHQDRLLATSCCVKWGERESVDLISLTELRAREHLAISQLLAGFFSIEEDNIETEENDDYSVSVRFSDGLHCRLRDAKGTDIDFIQKNFGGTDGPISLDSIQKVVIRLCVEWGEKSKLSESDIGKRPVRELVELGKVISDNFL